MSKNTSIQNTRVYEFNGAFYLANNLQDKLPEGMYKLGFSTSRGVSFHPQTPLTDDIFPLEQSTQSKVLEDILSFLSKKDVYEKFGILFKRGVLLHGQQGGGKTAVVYQLSKAIQKIGGVTFMVEDANDGIPIKQFRNSEPDRPILAVLEEFDELLPGEEAEWAALLDGENGTDNIVWLATTNHLEKIHPRFRNRPSRFDMIVEIQPPSENDRSRYVHHKIPDIAAENLLKIVKDTNNFSIAHLKELLIAVHCLGKDYNETMSRIKSMIETN